MSDLIDGAGVGQNAPEYSVSEVSNAIKRVIEGEFSHIRIRAEIGRVSMPRSGHVYLDLKDDKSVINGVIWKGVASRLPVMPEEGMEVVATGRITTFGGQSKYQIIIEDIKPAGVGALMAMFEKRKAALAAEGLFDPARKKELPYLPEIIGVVTSPSGAVIRDILHRLRERFPRKVLIWPVAVQGEKCAPEVAAAIRGFNAMTPGGALPRPNLIIVARGGGSLEDLWGFNEEIVARAAADSAIPLISAVGHETDTTLIDFVSDRRAPTPTAAAELAVPVRLDLMAWVSGQGARMSQATTNLLRQRGQRLRDLGRALPRRETLLDGPMQRLDALGERLPAALIRGVQTRRIHLADVSGSLRPGLLQRALVADRRRLEVAMRLSPALSRLIETRREALGRRADRLDIRTLNREVAREQERMEGLFVRLSETGQRQIREWRERIETLERMRQSLGYRETLRRGYAVVWGDGALVTSREGADKAEHLEIEFANGRLDLSDKGETRPAHKKPTPKVPPEQGSLL